jgi:hypothetical protein
MSDDRSQTPALPLRRPEDRVVALLGEKDPAAAIQAVPIPELYHLVKDVGIEDAHELLALASPEQLQGMLDLDAWSVDKLEDAAVRPWLEALAAAGPEKLAETWRQLDPDLTALVLQRWVRIYDIVEGELPDWEEPPFIETPDRFFVLKITVEDADAQRTVELLVDRLYRADAELARHTIRSAMSEPAAELEEMSLRWRTGRLTDLGFAPLEEALEVYQPIDVARVTPAEDTADRPAERVTLPAVYAEPSRRHFLGRVLARVSPEEAGRLEAALALLLNKVLSANRVSPSDSVAAAAAAAAGVATLSLGLETVSRGDLPRAEEALRHVALSRLHRVGHSVTLQLARLARVLVPRAGRAGEPGISVLAALLRPRPQISRALDTPPDLGQRPFASVADVRAAARALGIVAAEIALVRDALGVDPQELGAAATLGDVGRTALVRALLGHGASFAPLPAEEIERLARPLDRPAALAAFRALLAEKKIAEPQEFEAAISGWMDDLERDSSQTHLIVK